MPKALAQVDEVVLNYPLEHIQSLFKDQVTVSKID